MRDLQLDGLRGVAALGVVIFHAHYGPALDWMWRFVDLFFVLSGFLITRIILEALRRDVFSLRNFMMRRVLRIWPVYYLTLVLCLLAASGRALLTGEIDHFSGAASAPFFLQYVHHYFSPGLHAGEENFILWFHHSWSIAVEEQFYLLMPLLLIVFKTRLRVALVVMLMLIPVAVYYRSSGAFFWLLISRVDALSIGVALAFYWHAKRHRFKNSADEVTSHSLHVEILPWHTAMVIIIGLSLVAQNALSLELCSPGWRNGLSLFGYNLLFGATVLILVEGWLPHLNKVLSSNPLLFLGSISYALYVFHVPIRGAILFITKNTHISESPIWIQAFYFGSAITAAYLSKILLEDRVETYKHRFPVASQSK